MHLQNLKIVRHRQENRKGQTGPGQDAPPCCSQYRGAMSVYKPAARLPSLPRGPTQSAFSIAEAEIAQPSRPQHRATPYSEAAVRYGRGYG